jgi:hypothetical protein
MNFSERMVSDGANFARDPVTGIELSYVSQDPERTHFAFTRNGARAEVYTHIASTVSDINLKKYSCEIDVVGVEFFGHHLFDDVGGVRVTIESLLRALLTGFPGNKCYMLEFAFTYSSIANAS